MADNLYEKRLLQDSILLFYTPCNKGNNYRCLEDCCALKTLVSMESHPRTLEFSEYCCQHFKPPKEMVSSKINDRGTELYIHGSVHCDFVFIRSNKMQQYAGIYLLQVYSTCFACPSNPSSGVHQTVTAASGTGHST